MPSFIKIERGSDGDHDFKYNNVPLFARKPGNFNTSMSATPKLVPECKTSKKISFMAPKRKMEFDHVIDTRKQ